MTGTGLTEVVDDYKNGFLLPVGDTASMARAAVALLRDTRRLAEFKKSAGEMALEKFNSEKIVSEYESYYEEVLNA